MSINTSWGKDVKQEAVIEIKERLQNQKQFIHLFYTLIKYIYLSLNQTHTKHFQCVVSMYTILIIYSVLQCLSSVYSNVKSPKLIYVKTNIYSALLPLRPHYCYF